MASVVPFLAAGFAVQFRVAPEINVSERRHSSSSK